MTAAAPSGVVTFLFTDVEGSTRRWEADADAMRAALAAHDEVLRSAIEAHERLLVQPHRRRGGRGVRLADVGGGCCGRRAAGAGVAGADGAGDRRGRTAGRGLLRHGAQPRRAGDGRRARRSDPGGRLDGGSAQRCRSGGSGTATVAGLCRTRSRCFKLARTGPADGISAIAGARFESGKSAACDQSLIGRDAEVDEVASGAAIASAGHVDREWAGSARPAWRSKSRHGWPTNFPTGSGFSNWLRSPIRRRCPMRWRRCWASPSSRARRVSESVAAALEGRVRLLVFDNCEHVVDAAADLIEAILAAVGDGARSWPPAVRDWASPTSSCGRCPRWI